MVNLKSLFVLPVLLLSALSAIGQADSLTFGPEPFGGLEKLALKYYGIDFTKEQRAALKGVDIEFIYLVNEEGSAMLEEINGVSDQVVLDSLRKASASLPAFHPRTVNGIKESSLFFLKLQFPDFSTVSNSGASTFWHLGHHPVNLADFEFIKKSGQRLDVSAGAVVNRFVGSPAEYLSWGGGMKIDVFYTGKRGWGGGLVMSFYGNGLKKPYPIPSNRQQNEAPPTLLLGLGASRVLSSGDRTELNLQLDLAYAIQNVTPRLDVYDEDWVQLKGFSPGVTANYMLRIGREKLYFYYGEPAFMAHYINFHTALRPLFFNLEAATGTMLEVGVSYRFGHLIVGEYRLKQGYWAD